MCSTLLHMHGLPTVCALQQQSMLQHTQQKLPLLACCLLCHRLTGRPCGVSG